MPPDLFQSFLENVATKYGAKIRYKDQSWLMKAIAKLLFFNKSFMIDYTTTIGSTVYFPSERWIKSSSSTKVLAHELVHIRDRKKIPFLFECIYLFPQTLAIFSFFAILSVNNEWWLVCLFFVLFLTPLPAYGRAVYESRAYAMNMFFMRVMSEGDYNPLIDLDRYVDQFVGSGYFYMSRSRDCAKKMLWNAYLELPKYDPLFMEVADWYEKFKQDEKSNEIEKLKATPWL